MSIQYTPPKFDILGDMVSEDKLVNAIKFTSGPYKGLVFSYGKVEFVEDEFSEELVVKFEYDVHEQALYDSDEDIVTYLGDFLVALIGEQLRDNEVAYSGGIDNADTRYE